MGAQPRGPRRPRPHSAPAAGRRSGASSRPRCTRRCSAARGWRFARAVGGVRLGGADRRRHPAPDRGRPRRYIAQQIEIDRPASAAAVSVALLVISFLVLVVLRLVTRGASADEGAPDPARARARLPRRAGFVGADPLSGSRHRRARPRFRHLVVPMAAIERIATGFRFTEGPGLLRRRPLPPVHRHSQRRAAALGRDHRRRRHAAQPGGPSRRQHARSAGPADQLRARQPHADPHRA